MSRLMDKLRVIARGQPAQMGFGSSGARAKPPGIGLIAASRSTAIAADAADIADAVLLPVSGDAASLKTAAGKAVLGLNAGADSFDAVTKETGADLVVIEAGADALALRSDESARILRLSLAAEDGELRAVGTLPIEAVMVQEPVAGRLKIQDLLGYLRIGAMTQRAVIVSIPADYPVDQLVSLRDAGLAAVCVDVDDASGLEALRSFRSAIDAFPMPPKRERGRDALVPSLAPVSAPAATEPDHDDDDD